MSGAKLTERSTRCEAVGRRHMPMYEDGKIVYLTANHLLTTCQHCGARLERAHLRSPWWYSRLTVESAGRSDP